MCGGVTVRIYARSSSDSKTHYSRHWRLEGVNSNTHYTTFLPPYSFSCSLILTVSHAPSLLEVCNFFFITPFPSFLFPSYSLIHSLLETRIFTLGKTKQSPAAIYLPQEIAVVAVRRCACAVVVPLLLFDRVISTFVVVVSL